MYIRHVGLFKKSFVTFVIPIAIGTFVPLVFNFNSFNHKENEVHHKSSQRKNMHLINFFTSSTNFRSFIH
jgi:hypothetical protein